MVFHFVFPSDVLEPRSVDSDFAGQREAFSGAGFSTSLIGDAVFSGSMRPRLPAGAVVVYRGWMITPVEYERFASAVSDAGARVFVSPAAYQLAHYLPCWYEQLREFTPETHVYDADADIVPALTELAWPAFFIKDYVKSLKTSPGPIITAPEEAPFLLSQMRTYRGTIEGGICVRRVETFVPNSELRFFVLGGRAFGAQSSSDIPAPVAIAARRIQSPFFSIDVALSESGDYRIVELGDGQVSDLVGWSTEEFVRIWRDLASRTQKNPHPTTA